MTEAQIVEIERDIAARKVVIANLDAEIQEAQANPSIPPMEINKMIRAVAGLEERNNALEKSLVHYRQARTPSTSTASFEQIIEKMNRVIAQWSLSKLADLAAAKRGEERPNSSAQQSQAAVDQISQLVLETFAASVTEGVASLRHLLVNSEFFQEAVRQALPARSNPDYVRVAALMILEAADQSGSEDERNDRAWSDGTFSSIDDVLGTAALPGRFQQNPEALKSAMGRERDERFVKSWRKMNSSPLHAARTEMELHEQRAVREKAKGLMATARSLVRA